MLAEYKPPVYGTGGLRLVTASVRRPGPDVLDPKIHHANLLNSILAKIEANAAGADDALMLDGRGFVAETNATHLFGVDRRRAGDTPSTVACPEGITRQTVLDSRRPPGSTWRSATSRLAEMYARRRGVLHGHDGGDRRRHRDRRPDDRRRQQSAR